MAGVFDPRQLQYLWQDSLGNVPASASGPGQAFSFASQRLTERGREIDPNNLLRGWVQPQRNEMPSWNFGGGFNGGNGGLSLVSGGGGAGGWGSGGGGGWSDVFSQGLGVLSGWAMNRAQERAMRRENRRSMRGGGFGGGQNPYMNPYMNQNPNLGGAPTSPFFAAPNPNMPTTRVPGVPNWWPMVNPQPGFSPAPADTGWGSLDDFINGTYNAITGGSDVASPVVPDANGNPCVVRRPPIPRLIGSVNNMTGVAKFYRYVGAPILFRGDLQTLKTAKRAVSKFGGVAGARCPFRARRRR